MASGKLLIPAAAVLVALLHFTSIPRSIWEFDESLFAAAVENYEPLAHHPPPPGYPIYIGFAKVAALFTPDAFTALLATSAIALAAGFFAFVLAFRELTARLRTAMIGALLLYVSPAMLVSGTLPQSDAGAMALFGFAIWACARRQPFLAALLCAVTIGWRLQMSIAVAPMFLATVVLMRSWRDRINAVAIFGVACLAWMVPLVIATGGVEGFWSWLTRQAAYYAQHDAAMSRSGYSPRLIALRFIAHPWGPKWLSFPLLALASAGFVSIALRRDGTAPAMERSECTPLRVERLIPLAAAWGAYLAFALATMDPADAVRYALPALPFVALLAAMSLSAISFRWIALGLTASYAAGAYLYAMPVLRIRATTTAPPTAAARWIQTHTPAGTVVLYDLPLWPHAEYLLRDRRRMRIDAGLTRYGGDASVPIVILADGERAGGPGVTYRWPESDAYRKLTRRHYGAVSVIPVPLEHRFRVIEGVFAPERSRDGRAWRWVGTRGTIDVPHLVGDAVQLTFRAPPEYPFDANRVRLTSGGASTEVVVRRGATADILLPIADGASRIVIDPERTFVPAAIPGSSNRDRRTLSVMLTRVEQVAAPQRGR